MDFLETYAGALNLLGSVVGLVWTYGVDKKRRDAIAWRGWLAFWAGTSAYFLLKVAKREWTPWYVPELGLYAATIALLSAYVFSNVRASRWKRSPTVGAIALLVAAAAKADIVSVGTRVQGVSGFHQTLTFIAITLWAWRLRERDVPRSMIAAAYAVMQLPLQPLLDRLFGNGGSYTPFVTATNIVYLFGKLPFLAAVYPLLTRVEPDSERKLPVALVEPHDVFISYAREDEARAQTLVNALEAEHLTVWWDRKIPPMHDWRGTIASALRSARSVGVVWSPHSVDSPHVREEAARGSARGVLISVLIESAELPFGFSGANAVNLLDWDGAQGAEKFRVLVEEVRRVTDVRLAPTCAQRPP